MFKFALPVAAMMPDADESVPVVICRLAGVVEPVAVKFPASNCPPLVLSMLAAWTVKAPMPLIVPPVLVSAAPPRESVPPETREPPALLMLPAAFTLSPSAPDKAPPAWVSRLPTFTASEPELAISA